MRIFLIILLVCFSSFEGSIAPSKWIIEKNSTMAIKGSSNINKFTCDINEYLKPDTLRSITDLSKKKYIFSNSSLSIDIRRFDCHNKFITSDFRKMLKSDQYPELQIRFISLDEIHKEGTVNGLVEIELAGRKKKIDVSYHITPFGENQLKLEGEKLMKFSDFELEPPRKIAGMIRIHEEIRVHFNLFFRKVNS